MKEAEFAEKAQRYHEHMARFVAVHKDVPNGAILIELERRERWAKIMGPIADVIDAPPLSPDTPEGQVGE